ncbi:MAG: bestrophin-like domain [Gammaproteobacteria bacterium]
MEFLYQMSNVNLFLLIAITFIGISVISVTLIQRFIPAEIRYRENSGIASMSSLITLIYGVLAGLTALYLLNNISYTTIAVQTEANAIADIYRDSTWIKEPNRAIVRTYLKSYLNEVIDVEWPEMRGGAKVGWGGDHILISLSTELLHYPHPSQLEVLLLKDMGTAIKELYDARQQRIQMSYTKLSPEVWLVIIIGTILTLLINYLFGMNFYMHLIAISAVALMASSMVFLIVALERPFQGDFVIEPEALVSVLNFIDKENDKVEAQLRQVEAASHNAG